MDEHFVPLAGIGAEDLNNEFTRFGLHILFGIHDASDQGKFLVLDVDSGDYELDADEIAAVKRARAKHPGAVFYILRVGRSAVYRLGRKVTPAVTAC